MFGLVIQRLDDAIAMADGDDVPSIVDTSIKKKKRKHEDGVSKTERMIAFELKRTSNLLTAYNLMQMHKRLEDLEEKILSQEDVLETLEAEEASVGMIRRQRARIMRTDDAITEHRQALEAYKASHGGVDDEEEDDEM